MTTTQNPQAVEIYGLLDQSGRVRYVGKARDSRKRLKSHLRDMRRRRTPVYDWMRKCLSNGHTPTVQVLEVSTAAEWPERERYWIAHYRSLGKLLNVADGGDSPFCSMETRAANGRKVAALRESTPLRGRIWFIKKVIGQALQRGDAPESVTRKIQFGILMAPHIWGSLAKWL